MANKLFIKICGLTRPADLEATIACGADAVGFIAFPKSPRYVSPEKIKELLSSVNTKNARKVAVFVNATLSEILPYLKAGIDVAQLHGDESASFCQSLPCETWRAVRLHQDSQIGEFKNFPVKKFLIDSFVKNSVVPGGTGHTANWELAAKFVQNTSTPTLLAGGITTDNLQLAYNAVKPFGFDLSSSVESSPGIKNPELIKKFFAAAKNLQ